MTGGMVVVGGTDVVDCDGTVVVVTGVVVGVVCATVVVGGDVTVIVGMTPASIVRFVSPAAKTNWAVRPVTVLASESVAELPPRSAWVRT